MSKNHYRRAIGHPDREEQLAAFRFFAEEEMESINRAMRELEDEYGSIPEENAGRWNYHKGRLDAMRVIYGMFIQAEMQLVAGGDDGGPNGP